MTAQTLSGLALGTLSAGDIADGDDLTILGRVGVSGLGMPSRRTSLAERYGDGAHGGTQFLNVREVSARLATNDLDVVHELQAAMTTRANPDDEVPLVLTGLGHESQRRLYVRPERFEYTVDNQAIAGEWWNIDVAWIAADPVIYSETLHAHIFGTSGATDSLGTTPGAYFDVPVVNSGTRGVVSGRAMELRITAHGTVTNPYVRLVGARDAERVTWHLTMTGGQVLTTDATTVAPTGRLGSQLIDGRGRSASSPFLYRPRAMPGAQVIRVGATSGTISGFLKHRDTW
jgi:hypothetical protein